MKIHQTKYIMLMSLCLLIGLFNFALLSLAIFNHFLTFPGLGGGGWVKIENKNHLSPAEAETGAKLGNRTKCKIPKYKHNKIQKDQIQIAKIQM